MCIGVTIWGWRIQLSPENQALHFWAPANWGKGIVYIFPKKIQTKYFKKDLSDLRKYQEKMFTSVNWFVLSICY